MWRLVSVNQWNATEYRQEFQHLANIIHTCIQSNFILIAHRLACSNSINVGECFYSSNMTCYDTWMSSMAYISHGTTGFKCESNKGYMNERNKQYEGVWLEEGGGCLSCPSIFSTTAFCTAWGADPRSCTARPVWLSLPPPENCHLENKSSILNKYSWFLRHLNWR